MKNIFALVGLSALIILGGCKRGEEDPGLSFSSRDGRISGEWALASGSIVSTQTKVNSVEGSTARTVTITKESYDIASGEASYVRNLTVNETPQGENVVYTLPFEMFLNIQSDASYVNTFSGEFVGSNGFPAELVDKSAGFWSWIDSDKNKIGVNFKSIDSYSNDLLSGDYKIKRLSGSEMILVRNAVSSSEKLDSGSSETDEFSSVVELTFNKN